MILLEKIRAVQKEHIILFGQSDVGGNSILQATACLPQRIPGNWWNDGRMPVVPPISGRIGDFRVNRDGKAVPVHSKIAGNCPVG
jgi:hypothetical protein